MRRNPVFSHDELICKLITQPDDLELCLLKSATDDAKRMVSEEQSIRDALSEKVYVCLVYMYMLLYMYVCTAHVCVCVHVHALV